MRLPFSIYCVALNGKYNLATHVFITLLRFFIVFSSPSVFCFDKGFLFPAADMSSS